MRNLHRGESTRPPEKSSLIPVAYFCTYYYYCCYPSRPWGLPSSSSCFLSQSPSGDTVHSETSRGGISYLGPHAFSTSVI